jgi:predicted metal-dependent peptidase
MHIRRPFWAFSNEVSPAVIERGSLKTATTGGTSMACVLEHVSKTRPDAAIIITDGYIEALDRRLVTKTAGTRLHVLVTRDGNPNLINRAGLAYTQLDGVPA